MKKLLLLVLMIPAAAVSGVEKYKAQWKDLDRYPQAEWISEAKFGLYWHWNYNSIAGVAGWYGRYMYSEAHHAYKHHVKTYGDPAEFGYKDFAPLFTAKKFDAKQWVDDAGRIGARFIVGMAVHHDGFDLYDSSYTPWNSVDKLPHIDVIGQLAEEARKKGMKFGATSHLAWNWHYFSSFMYPDKYDAKEAPELYNIHDPQKGPSEDFVRDWYNRTAELIDKYELDFLWFDFGTGHPAFSDHYTAKLTAHFYNRSLEWNKTVALAAKTGFHNRESLMHDCEQGKFGYIHFPQWMSDSTMNDRWFHIGSKESHERLKGKYWILQLIDIVSKNGTLLLNLGPKADGSWPEEWKRELYKVGDWLKLNGEAIYGAKPWHRYGEGPTHGGTGVHYDLGNPLTRNDVRFTRKGDVLYATICGWRDKPIHIMSLGRKEIPGIQVEKITMLGSNENIGWKQADKALEIIFPSKPPCEPAYVFKIEGKGLFPERPVEYLPVSLRPPTDKKVAAFRISLPGKKQQLSIAEFVTVNTSGGLYRNVAPKGKITLSSTDTNGDLAIDMNMNGHPNMKSVTQTKEQDDPWLLLTFDRPRIIGEIEIFAGMDNFKALAKNGLVEALDADGSVIFSIKITDYIDEHTVETKYKGMAG